MAEEKKSKTSEAQIAVHWKEEEYIHPSPQFVAQANLSDPDIFDRFSLDRFPDCFKEYADLLDWYQTWHTMLDTSDAPCWKWFVGGKINASYNCVDRHLDKHADKAAFLYVPEPENESHLEMSFGELHTKVNEMAALLREFAGVKAVDTVPAIISMRQFVKIDPKGFCIAGCAIGGKRAAKHHDTAGRSEIVFQVIGKKTKHHHIGLKFQPFVFQVS